MSLFGRSQRSAEGEVLENVVGSSSSFQGTVRSDGGLRVSGAFEGDIEVAGNVVVGREGRVIGDIAARNVTVGGVVRGDIEATGQLQILATGQVFGDIVVGSVMIDEGGMFQGASRMRGLEQPALAPPSDRGGETLYSAAEGVAGLPPRTLEGTARLAEESAGGAAAGGVGGPVSAPTASAATATSGAVVGEPSASAASGASSAAASSAADPSSASDTDSAAGASADGAVPSGDVAEPTGSDLEAEADGAAVDAEVADEVLTIDDDFELSFGDLDIEPVIPDVVSGGTDEPIVTEPEPKPKTSRRSSRSRR